MDILVETFPGSAQNEHVVVQSPYSWLPQGARILLEPAPTGTHDNTMLYGEDRYHIRNVRVVRGDRPEVTRTAFEVSE